jgi:hypothetical protein
MALKPKLSMCEYRVMSPAFRADCEGLGRAVVPMLGGYCASKLTAKAAADPMAYEVAPSSVEVAIVQPAGAYPSRFQESGIRYWVIPTAAVIDRRAPICAARSM